MKLPLSDNRSKAVTLPGHLELLRHIAPPQAIIHIGAGSGNGDLHLWRQWRVPHALIIDADGARLEWAGKVIAENDAWQIRVAVLAATDGEAVFYHASNPAEDGLISPGKLVPFWPNLHITGQTLCQTQRLDSLLRDASLTALNQSPMIWIVVDCLSCLPILQGAGENLKRWSVLCLRVLLKPHEDDSIASLDVIQSFLAPYGYRCIHVTEGNHPAIGEALFVRDWHAEYVQLLETGEKSNIIVQDDVAIGRLDEVEQANQLLLRQLHLAQKELEDFFLQYQDEQNRLNLADSRALNDRSAELALSQTIRDEQVGHLAAREAQCHVLAAEKAALEQLLSDKDEHCRALQQDIIQLSRVRDEQALLLDERQSHIEVLVQERDRQTRQETESQARIELLSQANTALTEERSTLLLRQDALTGELAMVRHLHEEQAGFALERQLCVEVLKQEKSALVQQHDALASELKAVVQARDEQARLAAECQSRIDALSRARDSQVKHQQAQIDALNQAYTTLIEEKAALVLQIESLESQLTLLSQARDEQTRFAGELQSRIDAVIVERDAHAGQVAERQTKIDVLDQAHATLLQAHATLAQEKSLLAAKCDELADSLATVTQVRDEQTRLAGELQLRIDAVTVERDAHAGQAAERQTKIDVLDQAHATLLQAHATLAQEKSLLAAKCDGLADSLATVTQVRDEQIRLAGELQSRIDAVTGERDAHASQAAERQTQIDAIDQAHAILVQEKLALVADHEALGVQLTTVSQARDEQTRLAGERLSLIETLTQERDAQIRQVADRQAQIDKLGQLNATLGQEKSALTVKCDGLTETLAATTQVCDEQTRLAQALQLRIEALSTERDAQAGLAADRQMQIDALNQAHAKLAQEKSALAADHEAVGIELTTVGQARDEQTRLAAERQSSIDALIQERDRRESEWQAQTDVLNQANASIASEKSALLARFDAMANEMAAIKKARDEQSAIAIKYKKEIDQLQALLQQKDDRIVRMESRLEDNEARQRLFNEEMIKAEAQINLIKDVLLREQGL